MPYNACSTETVNSDRVRRYLEAKIHPPTIVIATDIQLPNAMCTKPNATALTATIRAPSPKTVAYLRNTNPRKISSWGYTLSKGYNTITSAQISGSSRGNANSRPGRRSATVTLRHTAARHQSAAIDRA